MNLWLQHAWDGNAQVLHLLLLLSNKTYLCNAAYTRYASPEHECLYFMCLVTVIACTVVQVAHSCLLEGARVVVTHAWSMHQRTTRLRPSFNYLTATIVRRILYIPPNQILHCLRTSTQNWNTVGAYLSFYSGPWRRPLSWYHHN